MDDEELAALLDHAREAVAVVDGAGEYRYVNAAAERLLGYAPAALVGRDALECVHPADRERVRAALEALPEAGGRAAETLRYRHRTAAGSWVRLECRLSPRPAAAEGCVVAARAVADPEHAGPGDGHGDPDGESRLREIAANAEDVLWLFSADWSELLFVNDAYEGVYGQSVEALAADPEGFLETVHPEDRPRVLEAMERLSDGEPTDLEYRVDPDRDYRRWVWVKGRPVLEDGTVARIAGFSRDITDRRRRERQLRVMDNLLRHNLRNDMNVILGHAEMARSRADPVVAESMETVLATGERLLETAAKEREIIDVLVGIEGTERLDLAATVAGAVEAFREAHPEATATLLAPDAAEVEALPEVRRALEELLENAAEHADDDPTVEVLVRPFGGRVEVEVRDDGPPIPDNEFEPLYGEEPDERYHGTGLGLWLVYWVVDLSDGDVEFGRPDGGGNVVTLSLPRAE